MKNLNDQELTFELDTLRSKRNRLVQETMDCETDMIGLILERDRRREAAEKHLESERGKERSVLYDEDS